MSSDAAYLRSVLDSVQGPVVLVGHSYGGSVITQAAAGDPDVKALVYIAAFIPDAGESAGELAAKFPGSTLAETLNTAFYPLPGGRTGTELTIKQDKFRKQFAADVPATTAAIMAATQRPVSILALEEKATKAAWKDIRSYALIAGQDYNIPPKAPAVDGRTRRRPHRHRGRRLPRGLRLRTRRGHRPHQARGPRHPLSHHGPRPTTARTRWPKAGSQHRSRQARR
ncbi:alpha/beta hydrolase [Nonomuraea sp. NPDC049784]|uniref:alpha/beta hydrolase n=1 Tax=Nonomuraea sp. NPDC049784 TaxID=3154361 RepID=UPI0033D58B2D